MAGTVDLDGHSRVDRFAQRVDMGAFEDTLPGILFEAR